MYGLPLNNPTWSTSSQPTNHVNPQSKLQDRWLYFDNSGQHYDFKEYNLQTPENNSTKTSSTSSPKSKNKIIPLSYSEISMKPSLHLSCLKPSTIWAWEIWLATDIATYPNSVRTPEELQSLTLHFVPCHWFHISDYQPMNRSTHTQLPIIEALSLISTDTPCLVTNTTSHR